MPNLSGTNVPQPMISGRDKDGPQMAACVVACRTAKHKVQRNQIPFFNAVNGVIREQVPSLLEEELIQRILKTCQKVEDLDRIARVVPLDEIHSNNSNLSIGGRLA